MNVEYCRGSTVSSSPVATTTGNRLSLCYYDELCRKVPADNRVNLLFNWNLSPEMEESPPDVHHVGVRMISAVSLMSTRGALHSSES